MGARKLGSQGFSRKWARSAFEGGLREQLKTATATARELRQGAKESIKQARQACLISKRPQLDEEDQRFETAVKGLRGQRKARKQELRSPCYVNALRDVLSAERPIDLDALPSYLRGAVEPLRASRAADQDIEERRKVSRSERRTEKSKRPRSTAGEKLREQDEAVIREIPEDLQGLWYQVRGQLKGGRRSSRAEAFLEWVEAHPGEVGAYRAERQRAIERALERELAEEQAQRAQEQEQEQERERYEVRPKLLGPANPRRVLEAEIEEEERRPPPKSSRQTMRSNAKIAKMPVTAIRTFQSDELDRAVERAIMDGVFLNAWRVGDNLEVAQLEGGVLIAPAGMPMVVVEAGPEESTKAVVERWIKDQTKQQKKKPATKSRARKAVKEGPLRPLAQVRAEPAGPRALLPAPSVRFLLPSGRPDAAPLPEAVIDARQVGAQSAKVEERDGQVKIRFDDRPRVELRERLKRGGFRWWAPVAGNQHPAWVAPITEESRRLAAEVVRAYLEPAPVRSAFEEQRVARAERLQTKAERLTKEAEETLAKARKMSDVIPFGQPIHVGHHSEGTDRRYREKIDRTFRKGFQTASQARDAKRRAEAAQRNAAISDDDPEALTKLGAKLEDLESMRDLIPAARKVISTYRSPQEARPGLLALGLDEGIVSRLTPGGTLQRYAVTTAQKNLSGQIDGVRRRIAALEQRRAAPKRAEERRGGARLVEEDNRLRIYFDEPPIEATRRELRSHGFLWAPSVQAWQRKPTDTAWYWARKVLGPAMPTPASSPPSSARTVAPLSLEPVSAAPASAGRRLTPAERTSSLYGPAGVVPPRPAPEQPRRSTEPDWALTASEMTPSLYGAAGPVPPLPGERTMRAQPRLPFTR